MIKKYLILSFLCFVFYCKSFGKELPYDVKNWEVKEQKEPHKIENWAGYTIEKRESVKFIQKETGTEIVVEMAEFESENHALGAYLELRKNKIDNLRSLNVQRARWSHFLVPGEEAGFWQGFRSVSAYSNRSLERKEWEEFLDILSISMPEGTARPSEFSLLLREETSIKNVLFALNEPVPNTDHLKEFFYAPWQSAKREIIFGFRIFEDSSEAQNYLISQTIVSEKNIKSGILTQWDYKNKSYPVILKENEIQSQYLFRKDGVIFLFAGNLSETDAKNEAIKLWEAWEF
ncbi:MAG: hypothetical protein OEZ13_00470 [Spirochaetia bacterium]|nr:hypothetical protein [Spirochaetia bacterium]